MGGVPRYVLASLGYTKREDDRFLEELIRGFESAEEEFGVKLVGGGGMLAGLDQRLANVTEVPVHLVDAPLECVVLGAGRCIENYDSLKVMFMGSNR